MTRESESSVSRERLPELSSLPGLTRRQTAVARHVAAGLYDKNIAARLGITERTVKLHQHDISVRWCLDPQRSRRAQIVRHVVELESPRLPLFGQSVALVPGSGSSCGDTMRSHFGQTNQD
jgi:DNA-binding NarL/FixJ family response regulator